MRNWFIPAISTITLSAATIVPAEIVYAQQQTFSVTVIQAFGWDYSNGGYKIAVETNKGNRFFVWYDNQLKVPVGSGLIVTYEMWGSQTHWKRLTNVANGIEANVSKIVKF
ncbi:hypothetical protein [Nostoc favosum]|uniref:Uncharacterized protein n=1 Tax=Nostoc favosum CHAB5714 TaxID=2780399 RepID=A0ABS8IHY5_9NOSO|nr:hypothetical protein [Nostoc favosum]MCC5603804.1 hypothetical protein [Nostoc favosum CHAB5714]